VNFYSSDAFLETLARVAFPGRRHRIQLFRLGSRAFRLLSVDGRPIVEWPFLDFLEPMVEAPDLATARTLEYLPRAATTRVEAKSYLASPRSAESPSSPLVDWSLFPSWEAFLQSGGLRAGGAFAESPRKVNKATRELGPLRFQFDDPDERAFDACIRWKSAQYLSTGLRDMFRDRRNVTLLRALRDAKLVKVSTLRAGEHLLAVHLMAHWRRRLSSWVPSYDPAYQRYSGGTVLLQRLLEHSYRSGDAEFDFLIGDEAYKFHYATHTRRVGPLGTPPWSMRAVRETRALAKSVLTQVPGVWPSLQALKRRW
jgi:hypothetical protein